MKNDPIVITGAARTLFSVGQVRISRRDLGAICAIISARFLGQYAAPCTFAHASARSFEPAGSCLSAPSASSHDAKGISEERGSARACARGHLAEIFAELLGLRSAFTLSMQARSVQLSALT